MNFYDDNPVRARTNAPDLSRLLKRNLGFALVAFLAATQVSAKPVIVLDPGHEPSMVGAISSCQKPEYKYNEEMVGYILKALRPDYTVVVTRKFGHDMTTTGLKNYVKPEYQQEWAKEKSLLARAAIANRIHAAIFISIHHDSVPEKDLYFDHKICHGKGGMRITPSFEAHHKIGFNVFIYDHAAKIRKMRSLKLARIVGKNIEALGRIPSNYHIYPVEPCASCQVVDKSLGVYSEDLAVLKATNMPAILIEVGNILDPRDARAVSTPEFRTAFSKAIAKSLRQYFKAVGKPSR